MGCKQKKGVAFRYRNLDRAGGTESDRLPTRKLACLIYGPTDVLHGPIRKYQVCIFDSYLPGYRYVRLNVRHK